MICNCCSGLAIETPVAVDNRSGLATIAYRTGTWATFNASMLAALGGATAHGLRTRDPSDFTIALLDACAVVADILTFYDERIANENYLRTATEVLSLAELSRLIGYTPSPGCSAAAYLAFRLNDPPPSMTPSPLAQFSSALGAIVPAGTKTQSVPGVGQTAQTFETAQDLDARWVNNALAPLLGLPYTETDLNGPAIFVPSSAGRSVGDTILLTSASAQTTAIHTVTSIVVDPLAKTAQLLFDGSTVPAGPLPNPPPALAAVTSYPPGTFAPNHDPFSDALVATIVGQQSWDLGLLGTIIARETWSPQDVEASVNASQTLAPGGSDVTAATARVAGLLGNNAPLWAALPTTLTGGPPPVASPSSYAYGYDWDAPASNTLASFPPSFWNAASPTIDLDAVYPTAVIGAAVVFVDGTTTIPGTITSAAIVTRALFALTARITTIVVSPAGGADLGGLHMRTTSVYLADAAVPLVPKPIYGPGQTVGGLSILLDRCALQLTPGNAVAVSGTRVDRQGVVSTEIAELAALSLQNGYTLLTFNAPLAGAYLPQTLTVNANVVEATNGETVTETLGSGDAGTAFQTFTLKQAPLTWTSAAVPAGIAAAITVRVNGIEWALVPYLWRSGPTDRVYTLGTDVNANTIVCFGDGVTGARLPTGTENVSAVYRRGLGTAGNVAAAGISMLITRPPGLRDVTNPGAASGGDDPETVADSRVNAPFAVKTLGRIVTLQDYADFARASTGVAKARVDLTFVGATQVVLVTVAGPGGAQIPSGSDQYNDLLQALTGASDGGYPIALASYFPITFSVGAALVIDPAYQAEAVFAAVQAALNSAFSFEARAFGQTVFASEVYAAIDAVPGVVAEVLNAFCKTQTVPPVIAGPLTAQGASISGGTAQGAQLLTIDAIPAVLTVLT